MNKKLLFVSFFLILLGVGVGGMFFLRLKAPSSLEITSEEFRNRPSSAHLLILEKMSTTRNFQTLQNFVKSAYPDEPSEKHELAHKLGEIVMKKEGFDGFGLCDTILNYGCFHGAALAAVRMYDLENLAEKLWEGCKRRANFPGNCLHGLGHATMIIKKYDLLSAYQECAKFLNENDSFWCQDGVSMENVTRSMAPFSLGPYGSDSDPYYPCNSIPKEYEAVCIRNHLGFVRSNFSLDVTETVAFCLSFDLEKTKEECMGMLGSQEAQKFLDAPTMVAQECQKTGSYTRFCIEGGVIVLASARQYNYAEQLCETLAKEEEQERCMEKIRGIQRTITL